MESKGANSWKLLTTLSVKSQKYTIPTSYTEVKVLGSNPGNVMNTSGTYSDTAMYIFNRSDSFSGYFYAVTSSGTPMTFQFQNGVIWIRSNTDGDEYLFVWAR